MKKHFIIIFVLFVCFNFFGNEKIDSSVKLENNYLTINFKSDNHDNLSDSNYTTQGYEGYYLENIVRYAKKTSIPWKINLALGIGFMVSGQLLFWLFGACILAAGIVLMNYTVYHTYAVTGWEYLRPYYNEGLALTITGGVCMLTGLIFIIVGGVNLGIAAMKRKKSRRGENFTLPAFALIADYNINNEEIILGARIKL